MMNLVVVSILLLLLPPLSSIGLSPNDYIGRVQEEGEEELYLWQKIPSGSAWLFRYLFVVYEGYLALPLMTRSAAKKASREEAPLETF